MKKIFYLLLIVFAGGMISFNFARAADPLPPNKTSPLNGQEGVLILAGISLQYRGVILNWDSVSGAERGYNYQVSGGGQTFENTVMETEIYLDLAYATQYQWNVRSCWNRFLVGRVCGEWGPPFSFTTVSAIGTPRLKTPLSPPNNAVGVSLTPILEWYPVPGATGYSWQISDTLNNRIAFGGSGLNSSTTVPEGSLNNLGYTYRWNVRARDNNNFLSPESETWQFTTRTTPVTPPVPIGNNPFIDNLSPNNGPVGTRLTINGLNFDPIYSNNTINLYQQGRASQEGRPISGDATKLDIIIPNWLSDGNVEIRVTRYSDGAISNPSIFSVGVTNAPGGPGAPGGPTEVSCEGAIINTDNLKTYQAINEESGNTTTVAYDGLVPCGKCVITSGNFDADGNYLGGGAQTNLPCQFCHFFVMFGGLVSFLIFKITIPVAVLLLVIGGAMFVFAGGQPGLIQRGNSIIKSVAIGLIIIFVAYLVVGVFLSLIGLANWTLAIYEDWNSGFFQINCPITLPD
jgi:hypothetical protein